MISDSLGPIIHSHGLRFFDTPSMRAERARCLYIRTPTAKWRRENLDSWRILTVAEQTAFALRAEHSGEGLSAAPLPMLGIGTQPGRTAVALLPQTEHRLPEEEQSAPAVPPVATSRHVPSARNEIIVDGRSLLSQEDAAAILGVCVRTLQRRHKQHAGPPQIKIGRRVYYDPNELMAWVRANRTRAQTSQLRA
ncbi:MAG TPA: helix-turn-helix domain-containing protein [Pseudolabrys sp.]|jgi:hypothetical protein